MNYYNASGQMDLSDRIAIETGICIGESFKKIAKRLRRHPSTIAHEVKENRTFIKGNYPNGKDCRMARQCTVRNLCGCDEEACNTKCRLCRGVDCTKVCDRYVSVACHKFDSPPYVCNNCKDKKLCNKDKYIYSAKFADAAVTRRRSESRQGVRLSDEKKEELDELVTRLVKKGQPLTHIYAEHENEMPVCLRTLYNYIDEGALSIKNIDLRRKTGYKPRKKKYNDINGFHSMEYRQCRTYEDFEYAMKFKYSEDEVTEMDTVKGVRESGKRLLTMIFRKNNVMLLFLMPDGKAESVKRVLDLANEPSVPYSGDLHSYILRYFPYFCNHFRKNGNRTSGSQKQHLFALCFPRFFKLIHFFIRIIDTFIETFFPAENYLISDTRFHIKFSMKTF